MLENAENAQQVLQGPFDPEVHKKTFIDYLEVIIKNDGTIEYAVPSHQEKLIALMDIPREEVYQMYGQNFLGFTPIQWLCFKTKAISVWDTYYEGEANELQKEALRMLKTEGLYKGEIDHEGIHFTTDGGIDGCTDYATSHGTDFFDKELV